MEPNFIPEKDEDADTKVIKRKLYDETMTLEIPRLDLRTGVTITRPDKQKVAELEEMWPLALFVSQDHTCVAYVLLYKSNVDLFRFVRSENRTWTQLETITLFEYKFRQRVDGIHLLHSDHAALKSSGVNSSKWPLVAVRVNRGIGRPEEVWIWRISESAVKPLPAEEVVEISSLLK